MTIKQIENMPDSVHIRTCQECGNKQLDWEPSDLNQKQMKVFNQRKCKKCKSKSLDYGSQNTSYDYLEIKR